MRPGERARSQIGAGLGRCVFGHEVPDVAAQVFDAGLAGREGTIESHLEGDMPGHRYDEFASLGDDTAAGRRGHVVVHLDEIVPGGVLLPHGAGAVDAVSDDHAPRGVDDGREFRGRQDERGSSCSYVFHGSAAAQRSSVHRGHGFRLRSDATPSRTPRSCRRQVRLPAYRHPVGLSSRCERDRLRTHLGPLTDHARSEGLRVLHAGVVSCDPHAIRRNARCDLGAAPGEVAPTEIDRQSIRANERTGLLHPAVAGTPGHPRSHLPQPMSVSRNGPRGRRPADRRLSSGHECFESERSNLLPNTMQCVLARNSRNIRASLSTLEYHVARVLATAELDPDMTPIIAPPSCPEISVVEKHERCPSRIRVGLDEI